MEDGGVVISKLKSLILAFVIVCFAASFALATEVTLAWDPNKEPDLAGYRIFCRQAGTEYDYKVPAWEGTETTCTISGLSDGVVYEFVARAFDTSGNESGDSNQVDTGPPAAPCFLRVLR